MSTRTYETDAALEHWRVTDFVPATDKQVAYLNSKLAKAKENMDACQMEAINEILKTPDRFDRWDISLLIKAVGTIGYWGTCNNEDVQEARAKVNEVLTHYAD